MRSNGTRFQIHFTVHICTFTLVLIHSHRLMQLYTKDQIGLGEVRAG